MERKNRRIGYRKGSDIQPQTFSPPQSHYFNWRSAYQLYLLQLYQKLLNLSKGLRIRNISFEEFVLFAYKTSSGYISPYA